LTYDISAAAGANVQFRFRLLTDSIVSFSGYYIDAVGVVSGNDCTPEPGGLVVGNVYDANTGAPLTGAQVVASGGDVATAVSTPDANVDDAFYTVFAPEGSATLTA
ncbi:hypothetical protein V6O07_16125, partial [Arthrospira platensis SPKY2]